MSGLTLHQGEYGTFSDGVMCTAKCGAGDRANYGPTSLRVTLSSAGTPTSTGIFSTGVMAHPAFAIAWQKKDQSTLSPPPPDLASKMMIPTWTPGQRITPGEYYNDGSSKNINGPPGLAHLALFMYIGLPIILGVLVFSVCGCCFWRKTPMGKRRARAKAERKAVAGDDGRATRSEVEARARLQ